MESLSLNKRIVYVTGLPRAGSTLLCQLFGQHPAIYSPGHSSPLNQVFDQLRSHFSDDPFLLAQLDVDFDLVYTRLINAYRGFLNGWFAETDRPVAVDKNRGWLRMIETVRVLDPEFRMVVCIRDLRQVFGSIEAQHQKTLLLDYPDHMAPHSAYERADTLFSKENLIGGPLRAIEDLFKDVDPALHEHVGFVAFESLMSDPVETLASLYRWLDLPPAPFDPQHLSVRPHESDSHYRWKYRHDTRAAICPPAFHTISSHIEQDILSHFDWFYDRFYAGSLHSDEAAQPKPGLL